MPISDRLKHYREQRGLTQQGLADAVGVTLSTIGRIECGIREPGNGLRRRLAEALGVSEAALVR